MFSPLGIRYLKTDEGAEGKSRTKHKLTPPRPSPGGLRVAFLGLRGSGCPKAKRKANKQVSDTDQSLAGPESLAVYNVLVIYKAKSILNQKPNLQKLVDSISWSPNITLPSTLMWETKVEGNVNK